MKGELHPLPKISKFCVLCSISKLSTPFWRIIDWVSQRKKKTTTTTTNNNNAIIGWRLYFKNKRNLELNNVHNFLVGHEFTFTMVKEWGDWSRRSRDILILIEWHKNISVQLWHASSNMQIHKSTVYEECLISLQPKVEADFLCSCYLARVQIYSVNEYTESLKL